MGQHRAPASISRRAVADVDSSIAVSSFPARGSFSVRSADRRLRRTAIASCALLLLPSVPRDTKPTGQLCRGAGRSVKPVTVTPKLQLPRLVVRVLLPSIACCYRSCDTTTGQTLGGDPLPGKSFGAAGI
ncbi:hypothetical protein BFW01_g3680 [Lasiodiplodia theobromae]|nr:hypothetical protein BFW01_g3680 [Lasiodiplodia theobromae]